MGAKAIPASCTFSSHFWDCACEQAGYTSDRGHCSGPFKSSSTGCTFPPATSFPIISCAPGTGKREHTATLKQPETKSAWKYTECNQTDTKPISIPSITNQGKMLANRKDWKAPVSRKIFRFTSEWYQPTEKKRIIASLSCDIRASITLYRCFTQWCNLLFIQI